MEIKKLSNTSNFQDHNLLKLFGYSNSKSKEFNDTYGGNRGGDFVPSMSKVLRLELDCFIVSALCTAHSKSPQGRNLNIHKVESINCSDSSARVLKGKGAPNAFLFHIGLH